MRRYEGTFYVGLCIALWSLIPLFVKLSQSGLDHHQYLFYSSVVSFLSLFIIALINKKAHELLKYSLKMYLWLAFLGFLDFFYYLLLYFGYQKAHGFEVLVVQYTWPIFIVLLSLVILKERLNIFKGVSLLLGFLGVMIVLTKGDISHIDVSNVSVIAMVMLGATSFALFSVLSKTVSVNPTNAVSIYFFVAILYSFISMMTFSSFVIPTLQEWGYILVNGIFLNGVSYLFWIKALQKADASFVAPFIFITPMLCAIIMVVALNEPFEWLYGVALVLIIASGLLNAYARK